MNAYTLLSDADRQVVRERVNGLLQVIEAAPKTVKWKLRAQVGTAVKWYKDVGDFER